MYEPQQNTKSTIVWCYFHRYVPFLQFSIRLEFLKREETPHFSGSVSSRSGSDMKKRKTKMKPGWKAFSFYINLRPQHSRAKQRRGAMKLGSCKILSICTYGTPGMHGCQIKQNIPIQRNYHKQNKVQDWILNKYNFNFV